MTNEGIVKRKVKEFLITRGAYWIISNTGEDIKVNVPDIVACYKGVFIGIEVEAEDKQPTLLKQLTLANIIKAGGVGIVINEFNLEDLKDVFEKLDELPDQNVAGFGWTVAPT